MPFGTIMTCKQVRSKGDTGSCVVGQLDKQGKEAALVLETVKEARAVAV